MRHGTAAALTVSQHPFLIFNAHSNGHRKARWGAASRQFPKHRCALSQRCGKLECMVADLDGGGERKRSGDEESESKGSAAIDLARGCERKGIMVEMATARALVQSQNAKAKRKRDALRRALQPHLRCSNA
eukprot:4712810-Pleurochrysis_carterae.AAC.1